MLESFRIGLPIPFYSQRVDFASPELDGFDTVENATFWQERGCGIVCLKMILDGFRIANNLPLIPSYGQLVDQGLKMGAYSKRGWIHAGLVKLANDYGVQGQSFRQSSADRLVEEVQSHRPCIASITTCFRGGLRNTDDSVFHPGGHLAVVLGFERENGVPISFIVNHPSSSRDHNWIHRTVDLHRFEASFSGAFMSFWPTRVTE